VNALRSHSSPQGDCPYYAPARQLPLEISRPAPPCLEARRAADPDLSPRMMDLYFRLTKLGSREKELPQEAAVVQKAAVCRATESGEIGRAV